MAYHHVVEMVDWSIKNVTFLCISFTKINHLKTRPPYLGAISNKFLSMVKNEVIIKTCIKKSYL
jgi:hypothetical protein